MHSLEGRHHDGHDTIHGLQKTLGIMYDAFLEDRYLLYNSEAVRVISVENIRAHERENRHDVV